MTFWNQVIVPALQKVFQDVLSILPKILAATIILLIGWLVAKLLDNLVRRILKRIGFNRLADRTGITGFLKNAGLKEDLSWVVGKIIFWTLMLIFLLSAAETLELTALALSLEKLVGFMPNLIVVIFVLVFGAMLARLAGRLVRGSALEAGIEFADFLGKAVSNFILIAVVVIAITQLNIQSSVLDIAFAALLGAFALAIALTIGMGTRNISYNIICGMYARKTFRVGQIIRVNGVEGELLQIGTANAMIRTKEGLVSLPNHALIDNSTRIQEKPRSTSSGKKRASGKSS